MANETLNDKAISALLTLKELDKAMEGVNDYGDATGFCAEYDQLVNDTHALLGQTRARASNLRQRMAKHRAEANKPKN